MVYISTDFLYKITSLLQEFTKTRFIQDNYHNKGCTPIITIVFFNQHLQCLTGVVCSCELQEEVEKLVTVEWMVGTGVDAVVTIKATEDECVATTRESVQQKNGGINLVHPSIHA